MKASELKAFAPSAKPSIIAAIVNGWPKAEAAGIKTPRRVQHFMTQIAVETGGLRLLEENLNYSSAQRIYDVFKGPASRRRFKSPADAQRLVRNPRELAIKVYGGRMGNAPAPSTDGWDYRGSGMMQTTGRTNFTALGFEDNPQALRDPDLAFETAVREWAKRGCNSTADADDLNATRQKINGGLNGIAEARDYLRRAKNVWKTVSPHNPNVKLAPEVDTDLTDVEIKAWQKRLIQHGFHMVGNPDGKMGKMTRGAIGAFQTDRGLPFTGEFDEATRRELAKEPTRPAVSAERAATTEEDLREEGSRTIAAADGASTSAKLGIVGGGTAAVLSGASSLFSTIREYLQPVMETFYTVPVWIWGLLVVTIMGYIWWKQRAIKEIRVEDVRSGKFVGQPGEAPPPAADDDEGD